MKCPEPVVIKFLGEVISSKNEKLPIMRRGRPSLALKPKVRESLDRLALQIPGLVRGLRLVHPKITMEFVVGRENVDRDNIASTLIDLLWRYDVLSGDSVKVCNGTITLYSAVVTPGKWETKVTLYPYLKI